MTDLAASLALYFQTPLPAALGMPVSMVKKFFEGKPFEAWRKAKEADMKTQAAIVNRLNDVIRATAIVAKTIARSR